MATLTQSELKIKIIEQLTIISEKGGEKVSPSQIALLCGFPRPTNTAKKVNPSLYTLQKEGLIIKECDTTGSNPKWSVVDRNISHENESS